MHERDCHLSFLTEVWEKKQNKTHQFKLEGLLEKRGITYISTPRPGAQRGGGAAIAVKTDNYSISKLNIQLPKSVEAVWGLLKPKVIYGNISSIIVCSFYSPPKSRKNNILVDHLAVTLQSLQNIHKNAGIIISGDRNSIEISALLSIDPSLKQIVTQPTRGDRILDVIVTNLARYYNEPIIVPPIMPDVSGHGAPSDHSGVVAIPNTRQGKPPIKHKMWKHIRPLPESLLDNFQHKLATETFEALEDSTAQEMVDKFEMITNNLLTETFPTKRILVSSQDQPWFNEQLRKLKRSRQREYSRHGRSQNYLHLKATFDEKSKIEIAKYLEKLRLEVAQGTRGSTYPAIKRLGLKPGDELIRNTFQLPGHANRQLSPAQSAEIIAEHFASISQEYAAFNKSMLPLAVQEFLSKDDVYLVPKLSLHDVYKRITKAKKPTGIVTGDLSKKVVQKCSHILAYPVSEIFNQITTTSQYPMQWKTEHQIPIPKTFPPESEDDLRNIAKTAFLSKVYESFLGEWLLKIIQPFLDPGQCGLKGFSTTHYLIKLLQFVHATLDMKQPHAVLAACIDVSKAFNRVDHCLVIQSYPICLADP